MSVERLRWHGYRTLLLVMTIGACASTNQGLRGDKIAIADTPEALIQMRRSGCMDLPCPVYGVSIFLDGTVIYDGQANVGFVGRRTWRVSPDNVNRLISTLDAMDFLDTPEKAGTCGDGPKAAIVVLNYRPGGCEKTVIHDSHCRSAPSSLGELEAAIDRLSGAERQAGSIAMSPPVTR